MTTGGKAVGMQSSPHDEVIGKIFVALSQDMRQCLICDGVFTRQGAAAHTGAVCHPSEGNFGRDAEGEYAERCAQASGPKIAW